MNISNREEVDRICAVITTFRPDDGFPERVEKVTEQVGRVVIVDDGVSTGNREALGRWFRATPNVIVRHQERNGGIAVALNRGIAIAKEHGALWILTLDDDSIIAAGLVQCLVRSWRKLDGLARIGILGTQWGESATSCDSDTGFRADPEIRRKRALITSGSFFPIEIYEKVGGFREDLFIDWVDYEYCARVRARGYSVIQIQEVGFWHTLGDVQMSNWGILKVAFRAHAPIRDYYYFRNGITIANQIWFTDRFLSLAIYRALIRQSAVILCLGSNKCLGWKAIVWGCRDALAGRLGRCEHPELLGN